MSKKHKSKRKPPPAAKKAVATAPIKAKNGARPTPIQKVIPAPATKAEAVAAPREALMPFWARMPFAMMDFWLSQGTRVERKS
jgi:hypothetical protein